MLPANMRHYQLDDSNTGRLIEPAHMEYTLPANMRHSHGQSFGMAGNPPAEEYTLPSNMLQLPAQIGNPPPAAEYTLPVKIRHPQKDIEPMTRSSMASSSDNTLPSQSQPMPEPVVPGSAEDKSDFTMPTGMNIPNKQLKYNEKESSLHRIL